MEKNSLNGNGKVTIRFHSMPVPVPRYFFFGKILFRSRISEVKRAKKAQMLVPLGQKKLLQFDLCVAGSAVPEKIDVIF